MADLRSGSYDCALVVGLEIEKTVAGDEAARLLGAAAWVGHEADGVTYVWPHQFSGVADEYDARYGLDEAHLHRIAEVNLANAKRNPHAQTRRWEVPISLDDDAVNPVVEGRLRRFDCSQITDGGAAVVLVNDDFLRDHPRARPLARVEG